MSFLNIPISIILGMIIGLLAGWLLARYFEKVHIRDTVKVLILLSISFLLVVAENHMTTAITFSALIAVMFLGVGLQKYREVAAKRIAVKCGKMWVAAEVFLFVLVGATVNIGYLSHVGSSSRFNLWRTDLPNDRGLCMSAWNGYEWKRKVIYDDGIHTESNRTGCNRRNSTGAWICVWRCGSDGSSACNCTDCTAWSICD